LVLQRHLFRQQPRLPVAKARELGLELLHRRIDIAELNGYPLQGVVDLALVVQARMGVS
jgi:hypothetical protein